LSIAQTWYAAAQSAAWIWETGMPLRMMVLNLLIDSLMPPSTDTPAELRCFFLLGPDPQEVDCDDSDVLTKVTCLRFCDKAMEGVVEDR
jgi:hypothetical protein